MSSGFSFNFFDGDRTTNDSNGNGEALQGEKTSSVVFAKEAPVQRLPFEWLDKNELGPLLAERSQDELVYTEIPLIDDECDSNIAGENGDDSESLPLRCVDLTLSSYRRPQTSSPERDVWEKTDIEPGLYEGGRKVWECSRDLVQYMVQEKISLHNRPCGTESDTAIESVERPLFALELGCGHGLPGCYLLREALKEKQSNFTVVFTDYNDSVVLDATISNIVLNAQIGAVSSGMTTTTDDNPTTTGDDVLAHVVLGAGDWMDMSKQLLMQQQQQQTDTPLDVAQNNHNHKHLPSDGKFDLILAAETIYSEAAARETAILIQRHLRPVTGIALVATKRYYFGVGGGVDAFVAFAADCCHNGNHNDDRYRLESESVKVADNGSGNIREVLRVQCCALY